MIVFLQDFSIRSVASRLGLLLLTCNLFLCSIPRCDFLRKAVAAAQDAAHHCHESEAPAPKDEARLGESTLCGCELLRFVSILPPEPIRSVRLTHASPLAWDLVSIVHEDRSDFIPSIEPPYPKV